jgi:hypothetical protein
MPKRKAIAESGKAKLGARRPERLCPLRLVAVKISAAPKSPPKRRIATFRIFTP